MLTSFPVKPRSHGVSRLDRRCLDVAVKHDVAVPFHHHHVLKSGELEHKGRIDLTQQDRIHGLDHINHAEVHRFEFGEVCFVDGDAVRQADAGGADVSLEAVVNGVSVLVERCSLPPRRVVVEPSCLGLLGNIETVANGPPLEAFRINGFPTDRFGLNVQRAGDRPHQQGKHDHGQRSTHVLPQPRRTHTVFGVVPGESFF